VTHPWDREQGCKRRLPFTGVVVLSAVALLLTIGFVLLCFG
jgi:hypothetical protein